jgi:hypothetical protein
VRRSSVHQAQMLSCCLLLLTSIGSPQVPSNAQLTLDKESVTAGDPIRMTLTADEPAPCNGQVQVAFTSDSNPSYSFGVNGPMKKGDTTFTVESATMFDVPGGVYRSTVAYFSPCPGFANGHTFKVPVRTLTMKAYSDPNLYPSKADLVLKPSQKQFLDTKIAELEDLDQQITTKLEGNAADTQATRDFLKSITQEAQSALITTEAQYRSQFVDPKGEPPAFFADFKQQYHDLLTDLGAPVPGLAPTQAQSAGRLLDVQFSKRSPARQLDGGVRSSTTHSPDVTSVRKVIGDNVAVYQYVKETGRVTFDLRLGSSPSGASVKYKKLIDVDYKDYGIPTDIPKVTLDLATWTFKFTRDGCSDSPVITIDPYGNSIHEVSATFRKCKVSR